MQSSFIKNKVKKLQGGREQKLPKRQSDHHTAFRRIKTPNSTTSNAGNCVEQQ